MNQGRPHSSWELFGRVGILPRGSEFLRGTHSSSQTTAPPSSALGYVASPMMGAVSAASGLCQSPGSCPDFERFTVTTASGPGLQASVVFARQGAALRLCPASIGIEGLFAQHLGRSARRPLSVPWRPGTDPREILCWTEIPLELTVPLRLNAMDTHHTSRSVDPRHDRVPHLLPITEYASDAYATRTLAIDRDDWPPPTPHEKR